MHRVIPQSATTRIVVVGTGVAGIEAAITIARTVPRAHVEIVGPSPTLCMLPELVYIPLGETVEMTDVPLKRVLAREGVGLRIATVERVDLQRRELFCSDGVVAFDSVVFAMGTVMAAGAERGLRTSADAQRIRGELHRLSESDETARSIVLRVPASCTWAPPALEFALLLAKWRSESPNRANIDISLLIENSEAFDLFGRVAAQVVREHLHASNVALVTNVPVHRLDLVPATVVIDFDALVARRIPGLPPVSPDGFYRTDAVGGVAPGAFVVGEATDIPLKAGFLAGWHARRVAGALGGDIEALGHDVDGIPVGESEYQMDLGNETMCVRFVTRRHIALQYLAAADSVNLVPDRPDKLLGTVVHGLIAGERASLAMRG
ncbi:MAG: hypothetical protein JWN41_77 [Thermoleophilia bacterium]|nr:hypothetical protein [Thermoleophilia bacterium]